MLQTGQVRNKKVKGQPLKLSSIQCAGVLELQLNAQLELIRIAMPA